MLDGDVAKAYDETKHEVFVEAAGGAAGKRLGKRKAADEPASSEDSVHHVAKRRDAAPQEQPAASALGPDSDMRRNPLFIAIKERLEMLNDLRESGDPPIGGTPSPYAYDSAYEGSEYSEAPVSETSPPKPRRLSFSNSSMARRFASV